MTVIDGTSAAGALPVDISQTDVYYFSPQKAFGADGGLWVAILSPEAIDRAAGVESSAHLEGAHRWVPPFLSLTTALNNSRKDQTLNTPAVATLIMMENQIRWLNNNGGLAWATTRCAKSRIHPVLVGRALRIRRSVRRRCGRTLERRGHH